MILTATSRVVLFIHFALVVAAAALAVLRLNESMAMPGLQAIELVLLALPWSLALGVEPFSRADLTGMIIIVVVGVVLNGVMLRSIIRLIERHRIRAGE
jgi:hypothetical protein